MKASVVENPDKPGEYWVQLENKIGQKCLVWYAKHDKPSVEQCCMDMKMFLLADKLS